MKSKMMNLLMTAALFLLPGMSQASENGICTAAPLPQGAFRESSPYGMRLHPVYHVVRMHWGVDLACPRGTSVRAVNRGVVAFAGRWGCYGNVVLIQHPGDVETLYAHLSRIAPGLRRGASVKAGEVIAWSGASGCVSGAHLHFEIWKFGKRVSPVPMCAALQAALREVKPWHRL